MDLSRWHVLIVEDELDSIVMVREILNHYGVRDVLVARNGFECLDIVSEVEPTVIVTDLAMPEMDGWRVLSEIRANPATAHIPVVAITAYHSANVAQDAMRMGFDAYFAKPFDPASFINGLASVVV